MRFLRPFALHRDASSRVLALATPVVLGSLSHTLLSVVDTAMVGRLGAVALAATGVAGVLVFAVLYALGGMSVGVQALVARRFGEQDLRKCGEV
ncbi:MAG: MATE family efflux transporter, partial [Candidatus Bipolaricaulia bacterium]